MHETGSYSSQLSITVIMLPTSNNQLMKGKMDFDSVFWRCHYMPYWSCTVIKRNVGKSETDRKAEGPNVFF